MLAWLCGLLVFGLTQAGYSKPLLDQEASDAKLDMAVVLMEKCGITKQIEQVPEKTREEILQTFKQNDAYQESLNEKVIDDIGEIIKGSFDPSVIQSILASYIAEHLSTEDMLAVMEWLDSPLGQKITHMEEMASTPEAYRAMIASIPSLKLESDYDERLALVHEIDKSVKATELIVDRMLNMQVITVNSLSSAFPTLNLPSETEIRMNFTQNRELISSAISREIALSILYTYRDISQNDLKAYINFMDTDHGKRYHQVIQEGTNRAYAHCGKAFSLAVAERISSKKKGRRYPVLSATYPQER